MSEVADKVKKIIAEHLGIDDMERIDSSYNFFVFKLNNFIFSVP